MLTGVGWATATVDDGVDVVEFRVSFLSDAVRDLLAAVASVQAGATFAEASWHQEPQECRWQFYRSGEEVSVGVLRFASAWPREADTEGTLQFYFHGRVDEVARSIARGFRIVFDEFGVRGYRQWWHDHPFPIDLLELVEAGLS